jgi:hypothetical protein
MNSSQAADLISILHGAYPGTYFDGPVAETFSNSFITNDYEASAQAVQEWVNTMDRFPTIAELNRTIRRIRGATEDSIPQLPRPEEPVDVKVAARAFERGYRQARGRLGDTDAQIDEKLAVYLRKFPGSIAGVSL